MHPAIWKKYSILFIYDAGNYVTCSFLCFEMVKGDMRQAIPLTDITRIEKKKALSILPGSGMAMEVSIKGYEKVRQGNS